jgi:hypothetical protein
MGALLRQEVLGLLATPLAPPAATVQLVKMESSARLVALADWLTCAIALSPAVDAATPTPNPPSMLDLAVYLPHRGNVCFALESEAALNDRAAALPKEALAAYEVDLIIVVLCADVTDAANRSAVKACLRAASQINSDHLIVTEPQWSAGILVERLKPLMPGDLDLISRCAPTACFDEY